MFITKSLHEEDHRERLDFLILQRLDFDNKDKVEYCISRLKKNIDFFREKNSYLKRKIAEIKEVEIKVLHVVPEYWHKYKKYRSLCKNLLEIDKLVEGKTNQTSNMSN